MIQQDDPYADPQSSAAPKDPWTPEELSQSQNWANTYYTTHGIPTSYGTPNDLGNTYLQQRRNGLGHQAAMDATPGLLGWDKYSAPAKPVDAPSSGRPTGGSLTDPTYAAQYVSWAASQPGVNPSVKNDPNYWISRFTSGAFGNDQDYALQRMLQAEGAPEGSGSSGGGGLTTPASIAPPATSSGSGGSSADQQKADELYNFLMARAHQSQIIDPNDPLIRSQSDNYSANLTRTGRQYLSELAERKGAGGNIGAESRMLAEKNAQAGASHEGDLIQHESDQRRQEIEQALQLGSQFMTAQQQIALQKELASIDNSMKLYQTQVQDRQFGMNLNQNQDQFGRKLNQDQNQFGSTMSQRTQQFNDDLRQRAYEYDTTDEFRRSPYATQ
jgi:hypothetical protein